MHVGNEKKMFVGPTSTLLSMAKLTKIQCNRVFETNKNSNQKYDIYSSDRKQKKEFEKEIIPESWLTQEEKD